MNIQKHKLIYRYLANKSLQLFSQKEISFQKPNIFHLINYKKFPENSNEEFEIILFNKIVLAFEKN
jgi:hypothetical protein